MKINATLSGVTLALLAATSAQAATVTPWGPHDALELGQRVVIGQVSFTDIYAFNLTAATSALVKASEQLVPRVLDITGGTVELFSGSYGDAFADVSLGAFSFDGAQSSTHQFLNLSAGNYYYTVNGTTAGYLGGNYAIASTLQAAVPEPETLALTLAGLGLLGAMARRRKIS